MKIHFAFCIFLISAAFGQTKPTGTEWKSYNQKNCFIQYPPDWELSHNVPPGVSFILLSPLESQQDKFSENVNLLIQDLSGKNINLDKYTSISETQIKTMMPNSNLLESTRIKKSAREYQKLVYTGDQGAFHLKFEQYYWVIKDKAYVLTFTAEQNKFDHYKTSGEKILNSFQLKK